MMMRTTSSLSSSARLFSASLIALKRGGKPTETPDYKQVYLPYDVEPTKAELEAARRKFSTAYYARREHRKSVEVRDVPKNMYTYGKEGMSLPIAIFKDQSDPVIGPEWTYPGIYENKIAARQWYLDELFEKEEKGGFDSPFQKQILDNQVKKRMSRVAWRMSMLNLRTVDVFRRERGASKRMGVEVGKEKSAKAAGEK